MCDDICSFRLGFSPHPPNASSSIPFRRADCRVVSASQSFRLFPPLLIAVTPPRRPFPLHPPSFLPPFSDTTGTNAGFMSPCKTYFERETAAKWLQGLKALSLSSLTPTVPPFCLSTYACHFPPANFHLRVRLSRNISCSVVSFIIRPSRNISCSVVLFIVHPLRNISSSVVLHRTSIKTSIPLRCPSISFHREISPTLLYFVVRPSRNSSYFEGNYDAYLFVLYFIWPTRKF